MLVGSAEGFPYGNEGRSRISLFRRVPLPWGEFGKITHVRVAEAGTLYQIQMVLGCPSCVGASVLRTRVLGECGFEPRTCRNHFGLRYRSEV